MGLVSIILTTFNSEKFLARSIESCLNQTYSNLELLIVDGGSTDDTLAIASNFDDSRIRIIHQSDNSGKLPGALNLGMDRAKGDFITWTQDDCWYELTAIETMVNYLAIHPKVGLCYTDYWFVDEAGNPFRYQKAGSPDKVKDGGDVIGQCFLFRREIYDIIGPQKEQYFPVHEIPWRIRLAQSFVIQPIHQSFMYYTVHPNSLTGKIGVWTLHYMIADALLQEGILNEDQYHYRLSEIHLKHAYEEFILQGNYNEFWKHLFHAARLEPQTLTNRGLWKLIIVSLLPIRESFRQKMLDVWQIKQRSQQPEV